MDRILVGHVKIKQVTIEFKHSKKALSPSEVVSDFC